MGATRLRVSVALLACLPIGCTSPQLEALEQELARIDEMPFFQFHVVPAFGDGSEPMDPEKFEAETAWWEEHAKEAEAPEQPDSQRSMLRLGRAMEENTRAADLFVGRVDRLDFLRHRIPDDEQDESSYLRSLRLFRIAKAIRVVLGLLRTTPPEPSPKDSDSSHETKRIVPDIPVPGAIGGPASPSTELALVSGGSVGCGPRLCARVAGELQDLRP